MLLFVAIVVAIVLFSFRTVVSYWVNLLWFRSLGYERVFWTTQYMVWGIFAGFAILTFVILFGAFRALRRAHLSDLPETHTIFIQGQPLSFPVERVLHWVALAVSVLI
ncbi:MAG: UPF0182 family protein, partial [Terracidiphilus sp.]